jgi:hypothetical protein
VQRQHPDILRTLMDKVGWASFAAGSMSNSEFRRLHFVPPVVDN